MLLYNGMWQEAETWSVAGRRRILLLSKRWQQKLPQLTEQEAQPPLPARPGALANSFPFLPEFQASLTKLSLAPSAAPVWSWSLCPHHLLPPPQEAQAQHSRKWRVRSSHLQEISAQIHAYRGALRKKAKVCLPHTTPWNTEDFLQTQADSKILGEMWSISHWAIHPKFLFSAENVLCVRCL